jgi:DNA invertase Pin-like site-specific DNA recombinase
LQDITGSEAKGAALKATEQPIDTSRQSVLGYVGSIRSFAEFETNLRKERQFEGIAKAKPAGVIRAG